MQRDIWISREDENYMRLCMLIDIGRKAVKIYFDKEFDPKCLKNEIKKRFKKLHGLKVKNIISEEQWRTLQGRNARNIILRRNCLLTNCTKPKRNIIVQRVF